MLLPAFSSGAIILKHVAENADDNLTTNSFFTDDQPWPAFLDCIFASESVGRSNFMNMRGPSNVLINRDACLIDWKPKLTRVRTRCKLRAMYFFCR